MNTPRDGIITANGLTAEFRFARKHRNPKRSWVITVAGVSWAHNSDLHYDPPKDLSPEAAAVVEAVSVKK